MDAKTNPLPFLSRPIRFGQPYHGKLATGKLKLSNGREITWPSWGETETVLGGDCYLFKPPGTPPVQMSAQEIATEAAAGREWRDYALLTGAAKNYAGFNIGERAWLYSSDDGKVWRIYCPGLNTRAYRPVPDFEPASPSYYSYPPNRILRFEIRRFGLLAPDGQVVTGDTIHRELEVDFTAGQSAMYPIRADPVFADGFGQTSPDRRRFCGDGIAQQWCPINIEDVSSDGSKCIVAVGRSLDQMVEATSSGRCWPVSWVLLTVTGSGDQIQISAEVLKYQPEPGLPAVNISYSSGETPVWTWNYDSQEWNANSYPPPTYVINGYSETRETAPFTAGMFFDANDAISEVIVGPQNSTRNINSSGSRSKPTGTESNYTVSASAGGTASAQYTCSVQVGGHSWSPGMLQATCSGNAFADNSGNDYSYHMVVGPGALGECDFQASTANPAPSPWPIIGVSTGMSVMTSLDGLDVPTLEAPRATYYGGAWLRGWDGLYLVRVTNKVYAVVAGVLDGVPLKPQGVRTIAIGSPAGWVTGEQIKDNITASYNPGTGEFVTARMETVGWV